jgi:hypothetical protein
MNSVLNAQFGLLPLGKSPFEIGQIASNLPHSSLVDLRKAPLEP